MRLRNPALILMLPRRFIDAHPEACRVFTADGHSMLPLHIACRHGASDQTVDATTYRRRGWCRLDSL